MLGLALLAGCATPPASNDPEALEAYKEANDPLEPMNRYFFELNYAADELLFKPLAGWYYVALPNFAQDGVRNALRNVRSPVVLANDLFQGETDRAGVTVERFLVNSTMGVGGLFDIASRIGLDYHDEDFGQTLAVAGVGEGPYLMLPLLGPSNPRDAVGRAVDMLFDPLTYVGMFAVSNISLAADGGGRRGYPGAQPQDPRRDPQGLARLLRDDSQPLSPAPQRRDQQRPDAGRRRRRPAEFQGVTSPQVSAAPLVPRREPLAKALPLFIIKETAGPHPDDTRAMTAMRVIRTILFAVALAFVAAPAGADDANPAASAFMQSLGSKAIAELTDPAVPQPERQARFRTLLDQHFDVAAIAKFTLGRYWRTATDEQRTEFQQAVRGLHRAVLLDALLRISRRVVPGRGLDHRRQRHHRRAQQDRHAVVGRHPRRLASARTDGSFAIVDIVVEGVSMAVTQRSEFASVIQSRGGVAGLLDALRAKNAQSADSSAAQ